MVQTNTFVATWLPESEGDGRADVLFVDYNLKPMPIQSWSRSGEHFKGKCGSNFWDDSIKTLFPLGHRSIDNK
jgi:beta-glucosidase